MTLNPYFTQGTRGEQGLIQDLINEQLRMYGVEIYYIPRKYITQNTVIKEVIQSKFDDAYPIEAYIKSEGYEGAGSILSKFGIMEQDDVTLIISRERWENYIQPLIKNEQNIKLSKRPKEGDLIYFPLDDRLYEIKYVDYANPFYQLQKLYTYEMRCELFRYEDEVIDTGINDIDDSMQDAGYTETLTLLGIGATASASTTVVNGAVKYIRLLNDGAGYSSTPTVAISSAPSGGINATAVAIMTSRTGLATESSISRVLIINPGAGYTSPPSAIFVGGGGKGAIATVGLATTGGIGIVTISNGGSGYSTAPTVTFSTPTHVGAAATAIIDHPIGVGVSVLSAVISIGAPNFLFPGGTTGGRFYGTAPTIVFDLPTGSGFNATANAIMQNYATSGGRVSSIAITSEGKFYNPSNPPSVSISAPSFSFAAATIGLAGSSINPSSIAFSTTGRAYITSPTVAISTGGIYGLNAPTIPAVGIATIDAITGIVTAVSFDPADPWAVGTGATIGAGYTVSPQITFSGIPSIQTATATATVSVAGTITSISIGNSGYGYAPGQIPTVSIGAPSGVNEAFRARGVATMRFDSVKTTGTIGIGSTYITGITTDNILIGDRIRLQYDYNNVIANFIATNTYVTQIGLGTIFMSSISTNVGIATTSFEFGINGCGIMTGIAVTFGGGGYLSPPTITIQNDASVKNYVDLEVGVNTARGEAVIDSNGSVTAIRITDAGSKYTLGTNNLPPQILFSSPSLIGSGDYIYNEIITGSVSGTQGRVKVWNASDKTLKVSIANGTFTSGETITGSESGAVYTLQRSDTDDLLDTYAENDVIQSEADSILDFSQKNPFGEV
jgi:hypothetical protein